MGTVNVDNGYTLADRFERADGRVYLTGWDALVRLPLMQRQRDLAIGLKTAGFVSGYPGSPLGGFDSLLRAQRERLAKDRVHFEPGNNEELAATSLWGTQLLNTGPIRSRYDGVFGMWYGKGPGVERSTDAIRTASFQGTARNGGVIALAGDDHDARSTVTAQQSEVLFMHMLIPVLNPATIQDYLDFGLAGWAMSRFASCWVGMICLNDTADSAASVEVNPTMPRLLVPSEVAAAPSISGKRPALELEAEIRELRHPAAQGFIRANGLDRVAVSSGRPRLGIVASGKAYLDVRDALDRLGLSEGEAGDLGISVYKLAMTWPLDPVGALRFMDGLDEVLVVEAKHPVIEDQLNRLLHRVPRDRRPELVGKQDERGETLLPLAGALDPVVVAEAILKRLVRIAGDEEAVRKLQPRERLTLKSMTLPKAPTELVRAPGFCAGCPHNTGTKVPDGSIGIGGTGCHGMAINLAAPSRETHMWTQMGGEGALWIGMAPFADSKHVIQNMGDGTYAHSGSLVLRAAMAAGVDMTFKILLNGYISMTGGQAIPGTLTAQRLARQVLAEGASQVDVVSDDPSKYRDEEVFPEGVAVHHRDDIMLVQERLREVPGVTVLIYDQACAAELRRERKKGRSVDPDKRVFIHPGVCEGCGDCNVQSNCIAVEPLETEFGRKRRIDQSSCNKDFSCLGGYCPSFVTLRGAKVKRAEHGEVRANQLFAALPEPRTAQISAAYNILAGGIGGGGILTIGALLGMAAHLEGKAVSVLNESGMAQKNGAVQSHIRISEEGSQELSSRIGEAAADLILGADLVVTTGTSVLSRSAKGRTMAIVNSVVRPTVHLSRNRNLDLSADPMVELLKQTTSELMQVDGNRLAASLMGDSIYANLMLLGIALQRGLLPVSGAALERAIELNGVSVDQNKEALAWGRAVAHDGSAVEKLIAAKRGDEIPPAAQTISEYVGARVVDLTSYQDRAYADRYAKVVADVRKAERSRCDGSETLSWSVARCLYKLMAYKDEYEVGRLYADPAFKRMLAEEFEGEYRFSVNLAPQIMNRRDGATGRARKVELPARVVMPAFHVLARAKRLRGTRMDVFGRTAHRKAERALVPWYEGIIAEVIANLEPASHDTAVQLASIPEQIRGFDTIKEASVVEAKEKSALLLDDLRAIHAKTSST